MYGLAIREIYNINSTLKELGRNCGTLRYGSSLGTYIRMGSAVLQKYSGNKDSVSFNTSLLVSAVVTVV